MIQMSYRDSVFQKKHLLLLNKNRSSISFDISRTTDISMPQLPVAYPPSSLSQASKQPALVFDSPATGNATRHPSVAVLSVPLLLRQTHQILPMEICSIGMFEPEVRITVRTRPMFVIVSTDSKKESLTV